MTVRDFFFKKDCEEMELMKFMFWLFLLPPMWPMLPFWFACVGLVRLGKWMENWS